MRRLRPASSGRSRFAHDLIRAAARADVPTAARLALHHAMAEHLASRADADRRAAEIAHHRLEALPAGDPVAAVDAARRASAEAMAHLAWEESDRLLCRALDGAGAPPDVRSELLIARAEAQLRGYDIEGSRTSVLAAAGIGRAAATPRRSRTRCSPWKAPPTSCGRHRGELCEQALAGIPAGDSAVRARLLAMLVAADTWRSLPARSRAPPKRSRWPNARASAGPSSRRCGPARSRTADRTVPATGSPSPTGCSSSARTATTMPVCGRPVALRRACPARRGRQRGNGGRRHRRGRGPAAIAAGALACAAVPRHDRRGPRPVHRRARLGGARRKRSRGAPATTER